MPFKSKSAKIRAKRREIAISSQGLATYKSTASNSDADQENQFPTKAKRSVETIKNYDHVFKEIVKIIALASLIIGLQLILSLSSITF